MNENKFGKYLKEIRLQQNVSQRELAQAIGVNYTYLSKIENGILQAPAEDTIRKIAEYLNDDAENMIILANKIPSEYKEVIQTSPEVSMMFRKITNFNEQQKKSLLKAIDQIEKDKN